MSKDRQNGIQRTHLSSSQSLQTGVFFQLTLTSKNIITGVTPDYVIQIDCARTTGGKILFSMTGKSATDYKF